MGSVNLKNYIKEYGINVWVEGYVILTAFNSPIVSEYILEDYDDIDDAIHRDVTMLSNSKVLRIVEILTEDAGEIEEIEETEDVEKVS